MPLSPGEKLGPYEILALIGKGGMGEVYSAHDPRTGRDVAIKVSAERFNERFDREVRAVASLNHPNICTLFDVGPNYLVMELVEGQAPQGPMPLEEALRIARQISDALEAAHEKGIVHRDLKPGNILIKADGSVKVLDFGLAKHTQPASDSSGTDGFQNSPTLTMGATQAGMILGTAAYLSPEQAKGKNVDKRADIWSFGVVLYELTTGKKPFTGDDIGDVLAAVIKEQPSLDDVPVELRRLLAKCLEKDARKRLRDIGDVWELLEAPPSVRTESMPPQPVKRSLWPWAAAALLGVTAAVSIWAPWRTPPVPEVMRFQIPPPEKASFNTSRPVLSPDGRMLAFSANSGGQPQIWIRALDTLEARALPGTDSVLSGALFWSPDSRSLGFGVGPVPNRIKRVEISGGPPQTLCDGLDQLPAGSWSAEGVIVFQARAGLSRVAASGGECTPLTKLDTKRAEIRHNHPFFLPDGRHFLYLRLSSRPEINGVYVGSLDSKPEAQDLTRLLATDSRTVFAFAGDSSSMGHLLFLRESTLMAQAFDAGRLKLAGEAVPVAERVGSGNFNVGGFFSTSSTGALAYRTGSGNGGNLQITLFDRQGKTSSVIGDPAQYNDAAFSPDGSQVAFVRQDGFASAGDIWVHEFARGNTTRLTLNPAADRAPVWSPDGKQIVFASDRDGGANLYRKASNNTGNEEPLFKSGERKMPTDWSRDGRFLLFSNTDPKTAEDLWYLEMTGTQNGGPLKAEKYIATEFNESYARFSPDGKFVAYQSNASGQDEVYVQTFPNPNVGRWLASQGGGQWPSWRRDGKELFYRNARGMYAVEANLSASSSAPFKAPKLLLSPIPPGPGSYDVSPDGQTFVKSAVATGGLNEPPAPITLVLNWAAGLRK